MRQKKINTQKQLLFRKFSRKKYAAFSSLSKVIKISTLATACALIVSPVQAQTKTDSDSISTKIDLEEVEIVGQKSTILIDELPRVVELIDAASIKNTPSQSYQDLIQYSSNIDISQRGQFGIQSDVSIRGGSFDQVLILQNGINVSDPQTGHHNLNLPVDRESIYKIEILNGPASRALGANAFSGAINIITKPAHENYISASINGGEFDYYRAHLGLNIATEKTRQLFSASYSTSNGYTKNTDFKALNFNYHGEYDLSGNATAYSQLGINNKAFGANSFYTPKFPDQFEETTTIFFNAGLRTNSTIKTKTEVFWRRHNDRFELFRENDDYYRIENGLVLSNNRVNTLYDSISWYSAHNYHQTDIFGGNFNSSFKNKFGTTSVGSGIRSENLLSNALGNDIAIHVSVAGTDSAFYTKQDFRNSFDLFAEHAYQRKKLFISAGALLHWNSFEPNKLNFIPGIDISYSFIKSLALVGSYNYTIGHPSFTDLKYQGPTNKGNENLRPYFQHSYEVGIKLKSSNIHAGILGFYTKGHNNINWVRNELSNGYLALNTELSENIGFEYSVRFVNVNSNWTKHLIHEAYIGYTYIETYRSSAQDISKYTNIKQKAVARIDQKITKGLMLSWNIMYKQRIGTYLSYDFESNTYVHNNFPDVVLIDLRASYSIQNFQLYVEGSNLLDKFYVESGSIAQPGRWLKAGLSYRFNY